MIKVIIVKLIARGKNKQKFKMILILELEDGVQKK